MSFRPPNRLHTSFPLPANPPPIHTRDAGAHPDRHRFADREALALRVDDLDLDRATVSITRGFSKDETGRLAISTPKTAAGVRTVSLPSWLMVELRRHVVATGAREHRPAVHRTGGRAAPSPQIPARFWKPAAKAAGMPEATPHQLRHLHVSMLVERGDPSLRSPGGSVMPTLR